MKLVVVSGVGTGVGKTHLSTALALAWRVQASIFAYKPVESGVGRARGEDEVALGKASMFHVKPPPVQQRFRAPLSPHLAARQEGREVNLEVIIREVARIRELTDTIVELPGGLFSPLAPGILNAHVLALLRPDLTLLVAPDRLGVLHDCLAVTTACTALTLPLSRIVLMSPEQADESTGTNAAELRHLCSVPVLDTLPRQTTVDLAHHRAIRDLVMLSLGQLTPPR